MTSSLTQTGLEGLHQAMAARVAKGEAPGMVTLVARDDDVHVDTIGTMAFDSGRPMRRDTIFRIASMTKPILAAATMQLVEDGAVTLEEPVDRLLPELAGRRVLRRLDGALDDTVPADRPITVEDLLTFRLGHGLLIGLEIDQSWPILRAADELELCIGAPYPRTPHDPDAWIERFGRLPLMTQPGQRWLYGVGSLVLGVLVARAAGQPPAVGVVGRADDGQPPDARVDRWRQRPPVGQRVGLRRVRHRRAGRHVAGARPLRLVRRVRHHVVQRPAPAAHCHRPDSERRLPVQRRDGRVHPAGRPSVGRAGLGRVATFQQRGLAPTASTI